MENLKIVIIGGVAAGATAATKCRRENEHAEITLYEKGPFVSFSNCALPMFIGGEIKQREKLFVTTPEALYKKYRINTKICHEVLKINKEEKLVEAKNLSNGEVFKEKYDKLIICSGAGALVPPIPGVKSKNIFLVKTVPDVDKIKEYLNLKTCKRVLIMGGGFIGLECAEAFKRLNMDVMVVEMASHILPPFDEDMASLVQIHLEHSGVSVTTGDGVKSFTTTKNDQGEEIAYEAVLQSGKSVNFDVCILSIGVRPEIQLAKECGIKIGESGGIEVDEYQQTSDPSIYAAGDATEVTSLITGKKMRLALATSANKQGGVAGTNAANKTNEATFPGVLGTCIVEVLGVSAAMTGLTETACQKLGIECLVSLAHPNNHVSVYPGASSLHIKLITEKSTNKILGCQIVGEEGVDKRNDVIATAIYAKLTAEDLTKLDLSYAPQFSMAKSPEHIVGSIATNSFKHKVNLVTVKQVEELLKSSDSKAIQFIDVREPSEIKSTGHLPNFTNIPFGKLREEIFHLEKEKATYIMCQSGLRSYLACRILAQNGFNSVFSVSGGALASPLSLIKD